MKYLIGLLVVAVLFGLFFPLAWTNVHPTEVAVQVNKGIVTQGSISPEPLGVGYHFYNRWSTDMEKYVVATRAFPGDVNGSEEGKQYTMELKTADGQNVNVDMTLQVALRAKEVPLLHQKIGKNYENEVLLPQMRSEARLAFGAYSAEEIYQGKVREQIQQLVLSKLQASFSKTNSDGTLLYPAIQVSDVLVRHLAFSQAFEQAIEQKKLAAQQVEINKQLALAQEQKALQVEAEARGQKLKAIQEGEAKGQAAESEAKGKAAAIKIQADADRYKLEQDAAGNLARYKADAEGKRLSAEALAGKGGENVVALKFAETIPPTLQTYSIPSGASFTSVSEGLVQGMRGMFAPAPAK